MIQNSRDAPCAAATAPGTDHTTSRPATTQTAETNTIHRV